MVFNCTGNITRWIFRAEETGNNNERVPRMSTWRERTFIPSVTTDFTQISQSGSAEELTGNGPVYEYVLQEPVEVQEGDFLGFDLSPEGNEELQFVFLDLGAGNAPDSYARTVAANNINIARFVTRNQQYLPLITAVIGESMPTWLVTDKVVYARSNLQQILQMVVQHQWSSPPPPLHPHPHKDHKPHLHRQVS